MLVVLHRERFEPTLPDVAGCFVSAAVSLHVRVQQSMHPNTEVAVLARPEDEMKVIRHEAEREYPHGDRGAGDLEAAEELTIIARLVKDSLARVPAIEDVVADATD